MIDELDDVLRRWAEEARVDAEKDMPRYAFSGQTASARSTRVIAISLAAACILALAIALAITKHSDTSPAGHATNSPGPQSSAPTASASDCPPIASQPSPDLHVRISNQYLALAKHCYYVPAGVPLHLQFTTSSKTIAATIGKKLSMILAISKKPLTRRVPGRPGFSAGSTKGAIFATPRQTTNSPATRMFRVEPLPAGRYVIALLEGLPGHASTLIVVPDTRAEPLRACSGLVGKPTHSAIIGMQVTCSFGGHDTQSRLVSIRPVTCPDGSPFYIFHSTAPDATDKGVYFGSEVGPLFRTLSGTQTLKSERNQACP
jgi:hypothetical protein